MKKAKPKIFLSYALEDIEMAKKLYTDLKRYGLDVWIDCESLLPGQNWKITIEKTIKQSQYYLLLLSSHSITKRGFIQKEMRLAYEMLEQCSEDDIYLIPMRLNKCAPSLKISAIHYIDLFPDSEYQNGFKKILQVVSPGMFLLRSEPKELSPAEVNELIIVHGFYASERNPGGKGFSHQYQLQTIRGDKLVFDEATGLLWQKSGSEENMVFEDANVWIEKLNQRGYGGFHDWRLPTLEEAMSLMEPEAKNNDLYIDPVFNKKQWWIWTSDLFQVELREAWQVDFNFGNCAANYFKAASYVRAVRSVQSSSE